MLKFLRDFFFPTPADTRTRAELAGKVVHLYYPLSNGEVVHKQLNFPDEAMAQEGYLRFMKDAADQLPGHAERKHLQSVNLNNELIARSSLNWTPSDVKSSGSRSLS